MKIVILSSNKNIYSVKRLMEEAKLKGHDVECCDPGRCYIDVGGEKPMMYFRKRKLNQIDAVIPRISASVASYGLAVVRQFEMMGIYCLNSSNAISRCRDKLRTLQILSQKNLPMPRTGIASCTQQVDSLIKLVGGAPLIVKLLESSQGKGVVLADTKSAAESLIGVFSELKTNFLVQEFVKDAKGADIRCFVVGDKIVGSMMRQAKEGEFRSNIHRGGSAKSIKITAEEKKIALKAAKVLRLNLAGVDIIRSKSGPKILEVNSSPGLEGIENATGVNIAKEVVAYIEANYQRIRSDN